MRRGFAAAVVLLGILISACNPKERGDSMSKDKLHSSIIQSYGSEEQEYGVTLFVQHHIEELPADTWLRITGTEKPSPSQVLESLVLVKQWDWESDRVYDFSLPGNVTDYVVSVVVDRDGNIISIEMES